MNIDTRYVSGDLAKDVQFLRNNLSTNDVHMIKAQLNLIMSVGSSTIEAQTKENPNDNKTDYA
jgi:hypothetical protein